LQQAVFLLLLLAKLCSRETFRLRPESERARYGRRSSEIGVSIDTELPDSSNNAREAAWAARYLASSAQPIWQSGYADHVRLVPRRR
jgi:hypothetical protein